MSGQINNTPTNKYSYNIINLIKTTNEILNDQQKNEREHDYEIRDMNIEF